MAKVLFTDDFNVTEFPQYGGQLVEGKKGAVEEVSAELLGVIVKSKKGKPYVEPVVEVEVEKEKEPPAPVLPISPAVNPATPAAAVKVDPKDTEKDKV